MVGSSPLTRGKRTRARIPRRKPGLIPAHAGKTVGPPAFRRGLLAHPRSRGENVGCVHVLDGGRGSSPLTRGKRGGGHVRPFCVWAHPRSRGENPPGPRSAPKQQGSSPLTRGKHRVPEVSGVCAGLIPAHAGKTVMRPGPGGASWAHPRSRGENCARASAAFHATGSSPLTRGKLPSRRSIASQDGLIPAHAGKTHGS